MNPVVVSALAVMGAMGLIFGAGLAVASRFFSVRKDERVARVEEALPGTNCGVCGAPACRGFAEGVVIGKYPVHGCVVGGNAVARNIAKILGAVAEEVIRRVAVVRCRGDRNSCVERAQYQGIRQCCAAVLIQNGAKGCVYGCLGFGDCAQACPFDAITMEENGLPKVHEGKCRGCGECTKACPRGIMELISTEQRIFIACSSKDFGDAVKNVCNVGCIGCSLCANPKVTAEGRITMEGKLPKIHYDRIRDPVRDLENAVRKCPTSSFGIRGGGPDSTPQIEKNAEPS